MTLIQFSCLVLAVCFLGAAQAQCVSRFRAVPTPTYPCTVATPTYPCAAATPTYPCSVLPPACPKDDIGALILLNRALENSGSNNGIDVEDIINKLVNALVLTTTKGSGGAGGGGIPGGAGDGLLLKLLGGNGSILGISDDGRNLLNLAAGDGQSGGLVGSLLGGVL